MKLPNIFKLFQDESLFSRCFRGGTILAAGSMVERGARLVRNMILARLLAPEYFGVMALVNMASLLFEALTEVGVRQAVVQNTKGSSPEYLNVAWWFSSGRGIFLYILGWLSAPTLARFYHEPALTDLLRVAFLAMVFVGFTSPKLFALEKHFRFGRVVLIQQGSGLVGTLLSLLLAWYYPNVWPLVIGFVAEAFFRCTGSFLLCPIRPKFTFDRDSARDLFRFSRGMIGLPILTYTFMQADFFIMGRLCSKSLLGLYSLAYTLAAIQQMIFTRIAGPIVLPAFSEIQHHNHLLRKNLLKVTKLLILFGLPFEVLSGIFSSSILTIIYGAEYAEVSTAFALFNLYMLFFIMGTFIFSIYLSIGRPELHRQFAFLRVILIGITMYPAVVWWDATGAAAVRLGCLLTAGIWQLVNLKKLIELPLSQYVKTWTGGFIIAAIIAPPAIAWWYWTNSVWLQLAGGMILLGVAWLMAIWSLRESFKRKLFKDKIVSVQN